MNQDQNNPLAFPHDRVQFQPGMTLRDYFAAAALTGWIASFGESNPLPKDASAMASAMYRIADGMLEARKK